MTKRLVIGVIAVAVIGGGWAAWRTNQNRKQQSEFDVARKAGTAPALASYLAAHPGGRFHSEASSLLEARLNSLRKTRSYDEALARFAQTESYLSRFTQDKEQAPSGAAFISAVFQLTLIGGYAGDFDPILRDTVDGLARALNPSLERNKTLLGLGGGAYVSNRAEWDRYIREYPRGAVEKSLETLHPLIEATRKKIEPELRELEKHEKR